MAAAVCNRDCFNCPFPDCVVEEMDAAERRSHREMDKDLMADSDKKRAAARQRAYYAAHREEEIARQKAYYKAHREAVAAYQRAYRRAHREEIAARQRAYYGKYARLGQAIRQEREARSLTQSALGRLLGVDHTTVSLYELGKRRPPVDKLARIFPEVNFDLKEETA